MELLTKDTPVREAWFCPHGKVVFGVISRPANLRFDGQFGSMGWGVGMIQIAYRCIIALDIVDDAIVNIRHLIYCQDCLLEIQKGRMES